MNISEEKTPTAKTDLQEEIVKEIHSIEAESEHFDAPISEDDLDGMSKAQMAEKLSEYLESEDVNAIIPLAEKIKNKFEEIIKDEYERKLKIFIQDGSPSEDFKSKPDSLEIKVKSLWKSLLNKKTSQRKHKESVSLENLSTKRMIIEELKEILKGNENFSDSYHKFQALQSKWRATGNVPAQQNQELKESFFFLTGKFYDMMKINNELIELHKKKNIELKTQLCEKAELLINEPSLKKAFEGLRFLQKEWAEIRNPSREVKDNLWQRFKLATDKLIERKNDYLKKQRQREEANLATKNGLCSQLELLCNTEIISPKTAREAAEKENEICESWQKTGFVPKSDNGNCWKKFKTARKNFHHILDSFYAKLRSEFSANLEKKTELCLKAEALQESSDWAATAEKLKKLQAEWKKIGPVAAKDSDNIWKRFRAACDHFFTRKNNQVIERDNLLKANIKVKETIIEKTNLFVPVQELKLNLDAIKKFQEEWLKSGEVPPRETEILNNTFGKSVENLLLRVKTAANLEDKIFYRLKYEQMLKSQHGLEQIKSERKALQDKIKQLQAEVIQLENNLGFFGKSKNANPLISEYLDRVEKGKIDIKEMTTRLKFIPSV